MGKELCVCSTCRISYRHTGLANRVEFFANFITALSMEEEGSLGFRPEIDESLLRIEFGADSIAAVSAWLAARKPEAEVDICNNPAGVTYGQMRDVFDKIFSGYDRENGFVVLEWV